MWNRVCPICFAKLSRTFVLSRSYELTCQTCHSPLELSRYSRLLASFIGFFLALLVFRLPLPHTGAIWVLRPVAVILAFSLGSTVLLSFMADLVVRPNPSPTPFPHLHS